MTPMQGLHADLASAAEILSLASLDHPADLVEVEVGIFGNMYRKIEAHANERLDLLGVRIAYLSAQARKANYAPKECPMDGSCTCVAC